MIIEEADYLKQWLITKLQEMWVYLTLLEGNKQHYIVFTPFYS